MARRRTEAAAAREAAYRERMAAAGFRRRWFMVHDEDVAAFQAWAEKRRRLRLGERGENADPAVALGKPAEGDPDR